MIRTRTRIRAPRLAGRPPARADRNLMEAFQAARYRVASAGVLRIGAPCPGLLRALGVRHLVGVTAHNPGAVRQGAAANAAAQRRLRERIRREAGVEPWEGLNEDPEGRWPPEPSLWAPVGLRLGLEWGRAFGQAAIVHVGPQGIPRLAWCRPA